VIQFRSAGKQSSQIRAGHCPCVTYSHILVDNLGSMWNLSHIVMILLNQNELEALRILWAKSELKPADIQAHFSWPIENATCAPFSPTWSRSGTSPALQGKAFYYAARVPKATLLQTMMHSLARVFADGSPRELVVQLLETSDIKPADLNSSAKPPPDRRPKKRKGIKMNLPFLLASPGLVMLFKWTSLLALAGGPWGVASPSCPLALILWRGLLCFGLALPLAHFIKIPGIKIPIGGDVASPTELVNSLSPPPASIHPPTASVSQPAQTPIAASPTSRIEKPLPSPTSPKPVSWGTYSWRSGLGLRRGAVRLVRLQLQLSRLRKEAGRPSPDLQRLARQIKSGSSAAGG